MKPSSSLLVGLGFLGILLGALHFWQISPRFGAGNIPGYTSVAIGPVSELGHDVFVKTSRESVLGFARRVNDMVHLSTYHCKPDDFSLSWAENVAWLTMRNPTAFANGILVKGRFGCGFCHQRAYLVHEALVNAGINSEVRGINGHVVVRFFDEGKAYFADPDFGAGPFLDASSNPMRMERILRTNYARAALDKGDVVIPMYLTLEDNAFYGGLDTEAAGQRVLFNRGKTLAVAIGLLGAAAFGLGLWKMRRRETVDAPPLVLAPR